MKNIFILLLVIIPFISTAQKHKDEKGNYSRFKLPENLGREDYLAGKIILKIKPEYSNFAKSNRIEVPALRKELEQLKVARIQKKFPGEKPVLKRKDNNDEHFVDLSLIYEIDIPETVSLEKAINKLYQSGAIEYAEPYYIPKPLYTSNDPETGTQYSLSLMKAFEAWDITRGDTNVVIGIVDTGTDFDHEDLAANIKYNYNDPVNGLDDDGDGYMDNFRGWNLGENNNYPQVNHGAHGVHVTGIAAAATDNNTGMAGVGFNCKYLPVKISNSAGVLVAAYEGIVYAANNGSDIINCSWGSTGGGQFGQDVVDYATFNKDALIVAGAGNNNNEEAFYPSAYKNVLSVGAINKDDLKWSGSSYGYYVDLCAPGESVFSSIPGDGYASSSGTSMAAPNAAGAAAIVKSRFPSFSALQIAEQLKVTADNIYAINKSSLDSKLGTGRINMFRALTETNIPSLVLTEHEFKGSTNNYFIPGDTLSLSCLFKNYLAPASNASVTLKAQDDFIEILEGSGRLGSVPTLGTAGNESSPFRLLILKNAPVNAKAFFTVTVEDGDYKADYFITLNVNVDYINVQVNDIGTTITSSGRVGYNDQGQQFGLGFTYLNHPTLLYEAGLMVGVSENIVSSCVRGEQGKINKDFKSILRVANSPLKVSDFDLEGKFNDNSSGTPLNISVNHNAYAWSTPGNRKFIIVLFDIINKGNNPISNMHAGMFADWDIMNYDANKIDYDAANQMSYAWSSEQDGLYGGIKLLSVTAPAKHYAIDNIAGGGGGVDITSGFDNSKKYTVLVNNKHKAGITGEGNDVIDVMSTGPFNLAPDDTAFIAFALIAGDNLDDLKQSAAAAQYKYDNEIPHNRNHKPIDENEVWLGNSYPNPAKNKVFFEFYLPASAPVELSVFNTIGQQLKILVNETSPEGLNKITADVSVFDAGIYIYRLKTGQVTKTGKLTIIK